ncbi:MAG: YdcF family protein [Magnetococcus sp. WYHC-3]
MNAITVVRTVELLLLPPGGWMLLLVLAGYLAWTGRRWAWFVGSVAILGLYLTSLPVVDVALAQHMEKASPPLAPGDARIPRAGAIVVLGRGRYTQAPEYLGADTLSSGGLVRVRHGAWWQRRTGLPLLMSGGRPRGEPDSEAQIMRRVAEEEFHVPVRWIEEQSRNTFENARYSAAILAAAHIRTVLLVTHARDMVRAVAAFEQAGLEPIAAPTQYQTAPLETSVLEWLPNAQAMAGIHSSLHELVGRLWYRLRY